MDFSRKIYSIAHFITLVYVLVIWSSLRTFEFMHFSSLLQIPILFLFAYFGFRFFIFFISMIINKNKILKKIILGASYFEGIWVGYYFVEKNAPVIFYQIIEQNIEYTNILSEAYNYHVDRSCSYKSRWHSSGNVTIDSSKSSINYLYEIDENNQIQHLGLFSGIYFKESHIESPFRITGFSYSMHSNTKSTFILRKISDRITIANINTLIQVAINFYEEENSNLSSSSLYADIPKPKE